MTTVKIFKSDCTNAFKLMTGNAGNNEKLIIDKNNNIYAATNIFSGANTNVYKSDGISNFERKTIKGAITSLTTSTTGDVYITINNSLYQYSNENQQFEEKWHSQIKSEAIRSITFDKIGNVYIGTWINNNSGKVYKYDKDNGETIPMIGTTRAIITLTNDSEGNIYVGINAPLTEEKMFKAKYT